MQKFFHKSLSIIKNHYFLLTVLFTITLLLQMMHIGSSIRLGFPIHSTLDFSWQSDSVERFSHGYVAGKNFIFTYGPLFQILESIPTILFHIPSYGAVLLNPLFIVPLLFFLVYVFSRLVTSNKEDGLGLFAFLFFIVGLSALGIYEQIFRLLPILIFSLLVYKYIYLQKHPSYSIMAALAIIPSFLGLYTYDLFFQCGMLIGIFTLVRWIQYIRKKTPIVPFLFFIFLTLVWQIITSLLLTGNLQYIQASVDTVTNYFYIMNIPWGFGSSNILFIFPFSLPLIFYFVAISKKISYSQKELFFVLILTAFVQLRTCFTRSDEGHIIMGIYPSIIVCFVLLYYVVKEKLMYGMILFGILFIILPYKLTYGPIYSPKNIIATFDFITSPKPFLDTFILPEGPGFTNKDLKDLQSLIDKNPENVFIYPYDSYVTNTRNQTYSAYALQLYDYSFSFTEEETVRRMEKRPPRYVIMGIDGETALPLDDIPNLTRNPLVALFFIKNYEISHATPRYLILHYNPKKKLQNDNPSCTLQKISFTPKKEHIISDVFSKFIKTPIYYLTDTDQHIRLPYKITSPFYLRFTNYDTKTLKDIFSMKMRKDNTKPFLKEASSLRLIKQNPFTKKQTIYTPQEIHLKVYCLN